MNTFEKQNEVMNLIRSEKLNVCAILETRLKSKKLAKACDRVFQRWNWVSNMQQCTKGCRIAIGWDENETSIQIIHQTSQAMFCVINAKKYKFKSFYTFVYAANEGTERRLLWEELINEKRYVNGNPWCVSGDWNVTLHPNEHSCGSSVMTSDMIEFQECINNVEVEDLCRTGLHFTWTKNLVSTKAGNLAGILKKLDRVMANEVLIGQYPKAHAKFLPYIISDHTPSVLCIPTTNFKKPKAFRFSNFITGKEDFLPLVAEKWHMEIRGVYMYQVVQKMKKLKSPLNHLGWSNGSVFKRVEIVREQLKKVQTDIDEDPQNIILRELEAKLVKDFHEAEADEEMLLFQQAKIKWLSDGDKNSKFFHKILKGRTNKSKILFLQDSSGASYEEDHIPKHFEEFLGTTYPVQNMEDCRSLFQRKLSQEQATSMIAEFSDKEIKMAMFDIDESKAPGPDGYTSAFFKKAWSVIGSDICKAVKEFFRSGRMLGEVNATLISLIPKPVLSMLVSSNQSAFIPGRSIQDNILLTQEVMKGYNRKGGPKRVAFKIDLQKAYDTVSWSYLRNTLVEFGFHKKMVEWIMQCVTTAGFTINVNGDRVGYFKGGRGLRQGDPISPYLFTLIMEVFSLMLKRKIVQEPRFQYHFGCKDIKLTHVSFADDLLVMCHGDAESVKVIKSALDEFSACSRLIPNNSKSSVFFVRLSNDECSGIRSVLPFAVGNLPVRYLGVPLIARDFVLWMQMLYWIDYKSKVFYYNYYLRRLHKLPRSFLWIMVENSKGNAKLPGRTSVSLRLTTLDKLKNWGDYAVNRCCLCCQDAEDLDHLMFKCEFASEVWNKISVIADMQINSTDMKVLIHHLSEAGNGNNIQSVIRKMAFAAAVYGIWSERNGRIFKEEIRSCDVVVKCITDNMRNKLLGIKVKDSAAVREVERIWNISCNKVMIGMPLGLLLYGSILLDMAWISCSLPLEICRGPCSGFPAWLEAILVMPLLLVPIGGQ
ncbi:RNA-directed DNA polymerase, eukaryota, reverse transcriptase zinc-binding domain protein [Tanacetum coccineum]